MCELYGMSSSMPAQIYISLCEFRRHGGDTGDHVDGWGLAYIDGNKPDIYREAGPAAQSLKMDDVLQHHKPTKMLISHIRKATQGDVSLSNTQPYTMEFAGHTHIFVHNGNLFDLPINLPLNQFKPQGETDSEYAFCYLMEQLVPLWQDLTPSLDKRLPVIESTFKILTHMGIGNFLYSDGEYLYAFGNERTQEDGIVSPPGLYYLVRDWNNEQDYNTITGITIKGQSQKQIIVASVPLTKEDWQPLAKNQLLVAKDGLLVHR